jgi:hypothetical protein
VSSRVFPGKGKQEIRVQREGDSEKGILEIEDRKVSSIGGTLERIVRIWDQWVDGDNSFIYNV